MLLFKYFVSVLERASLKLHIYVQVTAPPSCCINNDGEWMNRSTKHQTLNTTDQCLFLVSNLNT